MQIIPNVFACPFEQRIHSHQLWPAQIGFLFIERRNCAVNNLGRNFCFWFCFLMDFQSQNDFFLRLNSIFFNNQKILHFRRIWHSILIAVIAIQTAWHFVNINSWKKWSKNKCIILPEIHSNHCNTDRCVGIPSPLPSSVDIFGIFQIVPLSLCHVSFPPEFDRFAHIHG